MTRFATSAGHRPGSMECRSPNVPVSGHGFSSSRRVRILPRDEDVGAADHQALRQSAEIHEQWRSPRLRRPQTVRMNSQRRPKRQCRSSAGCGTGGVADKHRISPRLERVDARGSIKVTRFPHSAPTSCCGDVRASMRVRGCRGRFRSSNKSGESRFTISGTCMPVAASRP